MASDGSVIIDTGMDTSGIELGLKEIEQRINSFGSSIEKIGSRLKVSFSGAFEAVQSFHSASRQSMSGATDNAQRATQTQAAAAKATSEYDKQLAKLQKQIDSTKQKLAGYYTKLEEIHQFTDEALSRAVTDRQAGEVLDTEAVQLDRLNEKYADQLSMLQELEAEYARVAEARKAAEQAPAAAGTEENRTPADSTKSADTATEEATRAVGEAAEESSPKISIFARMLLELNGVMRTLAGHALAIGKRLAQMGLNAVSNAAKRAVSGLKSFASQAQKTTLTTNGLVKSLTSIKRLLITRIKRMFISSIFNNVREGIQSLAKYSESFDKTMSRIKNSAKQLSGNISVTLGNLITALEPVITKIIDLLNTVVTGINQFFAVLGGKKSYTAAKKGTEDYAKAADKAAKKQKKLNAELYSFDTLNRQQEKDKKDDDETGIQYETLPVNLSQTLKDWIERLKKAFKSGDWYGIGSILAEGLNKVLKVADDWINRKLRALGEKWADQIAMVFNGLVDGINWPLIGKTIADGLNALLSTVNRFLRRFNFLNLGRGIGAAIKSWFDNIDWKLAGETFANRWNALLHTIEGIVTTPGFWSSLGKSIGAFIKSWFSTIDAVSLANSLIAILNGVAASIKAFLSEKPFEGVPEKIAYAVNHVLYSVNWTELGKTLSDLFMTVLGVFYETVKRIDWYALGQAIGDFLGSIDWLGILTKVGEIIWTAFTGVLDGLMSTDGGRMFIALVAAIKGLQLAFTLTQTLWHAVIQRWIMTGISPLQSLPQLVSGIITPLKTAVSGLVTTLTTGLTNFTVAGTTYLHGAAAAFASAALAVGDALLLAYDVNTLNDAANTYRDAQEAHNREIDTALTDFKKLYEIKGPEVAAEWAKTCYQIDTTGMSMSKAQQALTKKIDHYWDNVPQSMWQGFKAGWNEYFGQNGKGLFNLLGDAFDGAVNGVLNLLGIHSPSTVFESIGKNLVAGFQNGFSSAWSNVGNNVLRAWTNLRTSLGNIQWSNIGQNMVAGLMNGIGGAWQNLVNSVQNLCSGLINRIKNWFGIHSPSTVFAEIGEYLDAGLQDGMKDGEGKLLQTAGNIAEAVTEGMTPDSPNVDMSANGIVDGMQAVLSGLGNIAGIFQTIADTLTAMGGLRTPQIAAGTVVPYKTRIDNRGPSEDDSEGITAYLLNILNELQALSRSFRDGNDKGNGVIEVNVNGRNLFEIMVEENNRAVHQTGMSPLRG